MGINGKRHFTYQDLQQTLNFSGAEIRQADNEIGTLVSVTTRMTVDTGGTTFSILLPRINIPGGTEGTRPYNRNYNPPPVLDRSGERTARFLYGNAPGWQRLTGVLLGPRDLVMSVMCADAQKTAVRKSSVEAVQDSAIFNL
jgi:hypothetical protein